MKGETEDAGSHRDQHRGGEFEERLCQDSIVAYCRASVLAFMRCGESGKAPAQLEEAKDRR